jgi:hypothetical protein
MFCAHCASEQPADAAYCPKCGRAAGPVVAPRPARTWRKIALATLVIALLPVALLFGPAVAAMLLAAALLILFLVPVLIGTFAVVLGAFVIAAVAVVGAIAVAATAGMPAKISFNRAATKVMAKGQFERTLPVSNTVDLLVKTHSGSIDIRSGNDATVRIVATVRIDGTEATKAEAEELLARIVAAPPIQQDGNTIHIDAAARVCTQ